MPYGIALIFSMVNWTRSASGTGVRSQAEIQANMNHALTGTESNLVAYWKFDEGAGTNASDATTNGHNGVLINGPVWVSSTVPLPPDVATGTPTDILYAHATLNGTVNPGSLATAAWFEWGTTRLTAAKPPRWP